LEEFTLGITEASFLTLKANDDPREEAEEE
jgi:hypothetical protein